MTTDRSPFYGVLDLKRPFILIDLETTSKDPAQARIWSIGMRIHRPNGSRTVWKTLVKPGVPLPPTWEEQYRINERILAEGCSHCWKFKDEHPTAECPEWKPVPRFEDIAAKLLAGFSNADFGGYHVRYDLRVLAEEFARRSMEFDYSTAVIIDSLRVWQVLEPRTLSDAVAYFLKRRLENAHDAMADISATEDVILAQLTEHPRSVELFRDKSMSEINELLWPSDPNRLDSEGKFVYVDNVLTFSFGKWKGKPVAHNLGYVKWMVGADFPPDVKRWCDKILAGQVLLRRIPDADQSNAAQNPEP